MNLDEIVEKLSNPGELAKSFSQEPAWNPNSLAEGYPGILLLFSMMQLNDSSFERIVHQYVLAIKKNLETQGINDLSLFSGVTGICFSLQLASCDGKRYKKMREALHDFMFQSIESTYLMRLRHQIDQQKSSDSAQCDLVQGISGIGWYALQNLSELRFEKLSYDITKILVDRCRNILVGKISVPGWHLLPEDILNSKAFFKSHNGNFNVGLAHGVAGILAFLSIAFLKGIRVENQEDTIKNISKWLHEWSFHRDSMIRWPYTVSWEEEVGTHPPLAEPSRDGWCYGVPGISRVLYLAGKALSQPELKEFAMKAFLQFISRSFDEWEAWNLGLCHGIGGNLLMAKIMSKEETNKELDKKIIDMENHITASYNSALPFGFNDVEQVYYPHLLKTSVPGLLEGTSGILLALLTKPECDVKWYGPLMIDQ